MTSTAELSVRRGALVLFAGWCLAILGCSVFSGPAQNGWSEEWGPMVPHSTFPAECDLCHYPENWTSIKPDFEFDHEAETGVPLEGAHAAAACLRCHNDRGPVQVYAARGCAGCHEDPHRSALGLDCSKCHDQNTWQPFAMVADHAGTRFPLTGAHAFTNCEACHPRAPQGEFRGAPVDCHFCHQREAQGASPNHVVNGWIRNCDDCHLVTDWRGIVFDHSIFPLQGGHGGLDCGQCHVGDRVVGTPNDCFSCHRQDYLNTPDHVAENFSTNCEECHRITVWDDVIEPTGRGRRR